MKSVSMPLIRGMVRSGIHETGRVGNFLSVRVLFFSVRGKILIVEKQYTLIYTNNNKNTNKKMMAMQT